MLIKGLINIYAYMLKNIPLKICNNDKISNITENFKDVFNKFHSFMLIYVVSIPDIFFPRRL